VRTGINACATRLFWRHVAGRAEHDPGFGLRQTGRSVVRLLFRFGGKTEVEQLYLPVTADKDVVRLEVAMDDAAVVRGGESASDLHRVVERCRERKRRRPDPRPERFSVEKFDGDLRNAVVAANVVDGEDVRVREGGHGAGFASEPLVEAR